MGEGKITSLVAIEDGAELIVCGLVSLVCFSLGVNTLIGRLYCRNHYISR